MDDDLRKRFEPLYRATDYVVEDPRLQCRLRIDEPCERLSHWLRLQGYAAAAFITACNPRSEIRTDAENREAMARLRSAVEALGLPALRGLGRAQVGDHHEPSLLVPGLALEAAHALMRRFQQNAFVWFERAAGRARLEWVQPHPDQ
ncbi:DUF3293 domain-containing protein [Aquimonas voraii]|uniref:DUF3293 domain-containing protein n=1 Tax=Aquimonas voraii TaxID=265719 RepID=A0A1G6X749_9GAMM|nr:DUF3293 domain-containing protein [Aquimonas voraii]SDD73990.1 Protein of unknown function [Aquimonas voraii]